MLTAQRVRVWDLPSRLFHWLLLAVIAAAALAWVTWKGFFL